MAGDGLVELAKCLKCDDLLKPGTTLVAESCAAETIEKGTAKKQVQVVVCNNVVVLSVVRKKGTFSSFVRRPENTVLRTEQLQFAVEDNCLTLGPEEGAEIKLQFTSSSALTSIVEGLKRVTASRPRTHGNGESASPDVNGTGQDASNEQSESSAAGDSALQPEGEDPVADGAKTGAVFERMIMWTGDTQPGPEVKCILAFREILDTERSYVCDLHKLLDEYVAPLQALAKENEALQGDLTSVFGNAESIYKANAELLQGLHGGVLRMGRNGEIPTLADLAAVFASEFERVTPFFKMYSVYCHGYAGAIQRLVALREGNREVAQLLQRREARSKNQQSSVGSLLIKPVQRICKYPLLFRELLSHMRKVSVDHPDFALHLEELCNAERTVQAIAAQVNTKVSEAENQDQVLRAFEELGGDSGGASGLVTPSRRFIRCDDLLMRESHVPGSKRQRCRMYVFNNLIVFARSSQGGTGTLTLRSAKASLSERLMGGTLQSGPQGKNARYKATHSFDLEQVRALKALSVSDEDGRSVFEVRRVSRIEAASGPHSGAPEGGNGQRLVTQIQRFEVWCDSKAAADNLMEAIDRALEQLRKQNAQREEAAPQKGKVRAWAQRAKSRRTHRTSSTSGDRTADSVSDAEPSSPDPGDDALASAGAAAASSLSTGTHVAASLAASTDGAASASRADAADEQGSSTKHVRRASLDTLAVTSLEELKNKYTPAPVLKPDSRGSLQLDIEFPPGPLGISLENSLEPKGVLVACVAAVSVAERGGIALGDRVVSVGGDRIPEGATWDFVVGLVRSKPRPLTISFERSEETLAAGMRKGPKKGASGNSNSNSAGNSAQEVVMRHRTAVREGDDQKQDNAVVSDKLPKPDDSASASSSSLPLANVKPPPRATQAPTRQWAANRNKRKASSGTSRLLTLDELESSYKNSNPSQDALQAATDDLERLVESPDRDVRRAASVLRELLSTEQAYVCDLRKLIGDYLLPMRQAKQLDSDDEQAIFLNAESLLRMHAELLRGATTSLAGLQAGASLGNRVRAVTDQLVALLPFFKVYATYCHKYPVALARLVQLRQVNSSFDQFLTSREGREENRHHSLQSLLIKPVQRICKYPLLISSLLDSVASLRPADQDLVQQLAVTSAAVERIAADVNAKVSEAQALDKVVEIQGRFGAELALVEPHRRFVSQTEVLVVRPPATKPQRLTLFLFNDRAVFGESRTKRHSTDLLKDIPSGNGDDSSTYKLAHAAIELKRCDAKWMPDSSVIQLTQVTRVLAVAKVSTCVDRFKITCATPEDAQVLQGAIAKEISTIIEQEATKKCVQQQQGASRELGSGHSGNRESLASSSSKVRSWVGSPKVHSGTGTKTLLEDMVNRYQQGQIG